MTDLLQCQLTNKEWYQASVDLLYSEVDVLTLKLFAPNGYSSRKKDNKLWDQHSLLNKLFQYCPSLLEIYSMTQDYSFWYPISYAASRLKHIKDTKRSPFYE
ncbi:hypothetical protein BD770DRAFT_407333 [Pilaira anomala]|nr:hypothetical protein BD770DRAFT_407333 [Pilaira anomala]